MLGQEHIVQDQNSRVQIRSLDDDDRRFIDAHGQNGVALLARYCIHEPSKVLPCKIAEALSAWRDDAGAERPAEIDVIQALGCLFGICVVSAGLGRWVVIKDSFGETLAVENQSSGWMLYPLDVISKRTEGEPVEELQSVYDFFANPPEFTNASQTHHPR
jgi:hypothetical protein